jgi:hypothetical protein
MLVMLVPTVLYLENMLVMFLRTFGKRMPPTGANLLYVVKTLGFLLRCYLGQYC